ncbi:MPDU1 (predicted) [Pycnogonum litorale]
MNATFKNLVSFFIPEQCYDEFFINLNFLHVECLKISISKALGIGIILGSSLVKVPQILKLFGAKSGDGINLLSVIMELLAVTVNSAYSYANRFPFSSWGEGLFMVIQTVIVATLVLFYGGKTNAAFLFCLSYSILLYVLVSGLTPVSILWSLQTFVVPVVISSKLLQAFENYRNGHTGQLSSITIFMLLAGSIARIFTSIQETGDALLIAMFVGSSAANLVLASQIVYYWNVSKDILKKIK